MSDVAGEELSAHYRSLESKWTISERQADYGPLVTPTGNADEPFHRWFHFKEGYSWALLARLFKDAAYSPTDQLSICDPFLGSGTTLVSALKFARELGLPARCLGVERNPAIHTIASAKVAGISIGRSLGADVTLHEPMFWNRYKDFRRSWRSLATISTTLNNEAYFPPNHVRALIAMNRAADSIEDDVVRCIYKGCIAAAVEPSGMLRRDGRALRFAPGRTPIDPTSAFRQAMTKCLEDLASLSPSECDIEANAVLGDARDVESHASSSKFDWIICSPPYPNNIDYTEVYKTESWALEVYQNLDDMRSQRLGTLRSHPSIRFPDKYAYQDSPLKQAVDGLVDPILDAIADDRYAVGRRQVVAGYADDMLQVLLGLRNISAAGGRCALVVGNSVHGSEESSLVIAADVMLARLGEIAGWTVEEIRVARNLRRRGHTSDHLRESVVLLRNDA
ncbi:hypothetical protein SK854_17630 [Lentzea sp. BCCO 10_0061]|uniref:DNA methylase N-4/N-6 domain-containing protein n=1 Tax=Lentzea sokolovensis TaxID=3095429 RepID=A0ABU4UYA5_9PSEU|nr:hypothetical protein [Lentzea sp. BCCO 10_0061]MDX8143944.1 hypothetical protein [Lentzea sp. BCCO 10_0061]